jgi:hypothetical protein
MAYTTVVRRHRPFPRETLLAGREFGALPSNDHEPAGQPLKLRVMPRIAAFTALTIAVLVSVSCESSLIKNWSSNIWLMLKVSPSAMSNSNLFCTLSVSASMCANECRTLASLDRSTPAPILGPSKCPRAPWAAARRAAYNRTAA